MRQPQRFPSVMYRPTVNRRDRAATIFLVALIHAGLLVAFLNASGRLDLGPEQQDLEIFDVSVPPPPPVVEELPEPEKEKPKEDEGAASAKNIESQATPVAAPKPRVELPAKPPVVAAPTPGTGSDATQGASDVRGPGTGAGGSGTGTGSGGQGSGTGGGGMGTAVRPTRLKGEITRRDYPRNIRPTAPAERVFVSFFVDTDGYVRECRIDRSSGNPALDDYTCQLIVRRFRYRPALDRNGRPIRHKNYYIQDWLQRGVPPPLPPGVVITEPTQNG